jgi:hypothetical protein
MTQIRRDLLKEGKGKGERGTAMALPVRPFAGIASLVFVIVVNAAKIFHSCKIEL